MGVSGPLDGVVEADGDWIAIALLVSPLTRQRVAMDWSSSAWRTVASPGVVPTVWVVPVSSPTTMFRTRPVSVSPALCLSSTLELVVVLPLTVHRDSIPRATGDVQTRRRQTSPANSCVLIALGVAECYATTGDCTHVCSIAERIL